MSFKRNYYMAGGLMKKKRKLCSEHNVGDDDSSLAGIAAFVTYWSHCSLVNYERLYSCTTVICHFIIVQLQHTF